MTTSSADHQPVRVLLADDQETTRSGIRDVLAACTDIKVVAETGDGREVLELSGSARPDVALINTTLPGLDGIEVIRRLVESSRGRLHVVVLSIRADDATILDALRNGATGFVLKSAGPAEYELAVRAAARGDSFLCPSIARRVIGRYFAHAESRDGSAHRITPRQRQILELVAEGNTTRKIAAQLGISVKTVEAHRGELMRRLNVQNIAGLVQQAMRIGLLSP